MKWNRRVDPSVVCDARYLHNLQRWRIIQKRREGSRVWRIARDLRVAEEVVKQVLISAGWNGLGLEHQIEREPV